MAGPWRMSPSEGWRWILTPQTNLDRVFPFPAPIGFCAHLKLESALVSMSGTSPRTKSVLCASFAMSRLQKLLSSRLSRFLALELLTGCECSSPVCNNPFTIHMAKKPKNNKWSTHTQKKKWTRDGPGRALCSVPPGAVLIWTLWEGDEGQALGGCPQKPLQRRGLQTNPTAERRWWGARAVFVQEKGAEIYSEWRENEPRLGLDENRSSRPVEGPIWVIGSSKQNQSIRWQELRNWDLCETGPLFQQHRMQIWLKTVCFKVVQHQFMAFFFLQCYLFKPEMKSTALSKAWWARALDASLLILLSKEWCGFKSFFCHSLKLPGRWCSLACAMHHTHPCWHHHPLYSRACHGGLPKLILPWDFSSWWRT